jgi:hypothetical protein
MRIMTATKASRRYAAVAEAIGAPLLTLDSRLACANGLTCEVQVIEG